MKVELKAAQPNIGKLLKQKRIKVDENGDVIGNPKNPVGGDGKGKKIKRRVSSVNPQTGTLESTVVEIPRNSGHALGENSVWRVAMCKPKMTIGRYTIEASCPEEMYDKMCEIYEEMKDQGKGSDDFRPELEKEEWDAYKVWKSSQKEKRG